MEKKELTKAAIPKNLGGYLAKQAAKSATKDDHMKNMMNSTRMVMHHGHSIAVETMYVVKVDGKKTNISLMVGDDGQVHCHAIPNYQFDSALDMVKVIVDQFPDDFPLKPKASGGRTKATTPKQRPNSKRGK